MAAEHFEHSSARSPHADVLQVLRALTWDNEECFKADLAWLETLTGDQVDRWLVQLPQLKNPRTGQNRRARTFQSSYPGGNGSSRGKDNG